MRNPQCFPRLVPDPTEAIAGQRFIYVVYMKVWLVWVCGGEVLRFWSDFGVRGHLEAGLKPGAYTAIHQVARFTSLLGSCSFCLFVKPDFQGGEIVRYGGGVHLFLA